MTRPRKLSPTLTLGQRIAPPRFVAFVLISLAAFAFAIRTAGWPQAALIGFDIGALTFLLSSIPLFGHQANRMREAAQRNDANRAVLLAITAIVCLVVLVAIAVELGNRDRMSPPAIILVVGTLLIAWLFSNLVYALHYAHLFYSPKAGGGDSGGIDFPSDGDPDYGDFVYFAFTLGMTFQTSDVAITSRLIRRTVIAHCFAAFIFNIGVLAFTINVLGG